MNKNLLSVIASLACFTLGSEKLSAQNTFYVGSDAQNGTVPSGCTECPNSGNTCCQFLDAFYYGNDPSSATTIYINSGIGTINYQDTVNFGNENANATVISQNSGGTIINFNSQSSISGAVFQPTYNGINGSGSVILSNVVFQNASSSYPIALAGGSITLSGTSVTNGSFLYNTWNVGLYEGQNPSFIFGTLAGSGSYTTAFSDNISYLVDGTIFNITNSSGYDVTLSGSISSNRGQSNVLVLNVENANLIVTGVITVDTLINNGTGSSLYLKPSNPNSIGAIQLNNTYLHVNSNNGLGGASEISITTNTNPCTLTFDVETSDLTFNTPISYAVENATFNLNNYSNSNLTFAGNIYDSSQTGNLISNLLSNDLTITGTITVNQLIPRTNTHALYLEPNSANSINTISLEDGSYLHINSNNSLGGVTGISIANGAVCGLTLESPSVSYGDFNIPISLPESAIFNLNNNSGSGVFFNGTIEYSVGGNANVEINTNNGITLRGLIQVNSLRIDSGNISLEPSGVTNNIGDLYLRGGSLSINSNNSLGGVSRLHVTNNATSGLTFAAATYSEFNIPIGFDTQDTMLTFTNNSGGDITWSGSIEGAASAYLNVYANSPVYLRGEFTANILGASNGHVFLEPNNGINNNITTINIGENGYLHVNSTASTGSSTALNVNNGSILYLENGGSYSSDNISITYATTNANFTIDNYSGGDVTLGGNISGTTGCTLTMNGFTGQTTLTGIISVPTLNTAQGTTYVFPSSPTSNTIDTVSMTNSNLRINSNGSFGTGATTIYIENLGELSICNTFTSTSPFGSNYTIQLASGPSTTATNVIDDAGYPVNIASQITSTGTYFKAGSGIQTLTNTGNDYSGGTIVSGGTLSISSIYAIGTGTTFQLNGGGLYVSQNVTIPIGNSLTITSSGGCLSAVSGTTLEIDAPITASGPLQIGPTANSAFLNPNDPTGTVYLTSSSNDFSSNTITVGGIYNGIAYPATLSATASNLGNLGGLTLQYGGIFSTDATIPLNVPITIGTTSGTLSIAQNTTLTLPSTISSTSDNSTLYVQGGGTLSVTGTNSDFKGNWAVEENSTLNISIASNLGSSQSLTLTSGTLGVQGNLSTQQSLILEGYPTISVSSGNTASFSSLDTTALSSFTKTGSGTLSILPSSLSNIPSLMISQGTFIGNAFSLNTSTITLSSDTTLGFSESSEGTFTGSISGSGYVSILGTAPLIFSPTSSTYTGGTLLSGPITINQDNLGAPGSPLMMMDGGVLTTISSFSISRYTTISGNTTFYQDSKTALQMKGSIVGNGDINKDGAGALVLSGDSPSYTGTIFVNEGALVVNANFSNSGDPITSQGTLLSGTGTVGSTDVYGTIKGGNPLGTLNINGELILEEGSHFATLISPNSHSLVSVSGDVTINPNTTYLVGFIPGSYVGSDLVILTGNTIQGKFTQVGNGESLASYFFTNNLVYTGTEVTLALTKKSVTPLASGQNAINVAGALDNAIHFNRTEVTFNIVPGDVSADPSPELPRLLLSLLPYSDDPDAMTYALNELHPAQLKGLAIAQESNIVQVREAVSQRMQNELDLINCSLEKDTTCARNKKTMTPWITGIGESLGQNTKTNSWGPLTGYRSNMGGFGVGIDGRFAQNFFAGALSGYTHSHMHWKSDKGQGNISTGYAGLYLSGVGKMFYGNASVIGSWSHYNTDRYIEYGRINKIAKNSHGGSQILSHLDTGINWNYLDLTIRPFDSVDYISQVENSYTEYNAGDWNLHVKNNNEIMIRNELGLQLAKCFCAWNSKWTIAPKLSWIYESRVKGNHFTTNFVGGGTPFFIEGYFPDRSLFAPGIVVTGMMLEDSLAFNLYYNGEFGSGYSANTYGGQVRYAF